MNTSPNNESFTDTNSPNTDWSSLEEMPAFDPNSSRDHEGLSSITIEKLSPDDNFDQVAEALYLTDQYICPDFFGDENRAKQFAPALFSEDPNTMFSYDKTIVAKDESGNIAGVLAYRDSNCKPWDADATEARFKATGVTLPEHFDRANRVYMPKITAEMFPGTAEIEFVGVRDDYRSQGIGKRMIQSLIDSPKYTELHLDVLDSHPWASQSYCELGFKPDGEKFGNYPDGSEGVQHMVLVKNS